ncbi:hypothetical protein NP1_52 [Xanthomonas phage NP1]|nr:hypothetical protein NP1_52 [Xanthomonas phage NP1]
MNQPLTVLHDHKTGVLRIALEALLATQRKLHEGMEDSDDQDRTICAHVSNQIFERGQSPYHREVQAVLRKTAQTWPYYSGEQLVPVPAPEETWDALDALVAKGLLVEDHDSTPAEQIYQAVFHGHLYGGSFWDLETEYGRMRADLLEHNIRTIEAELNYRSETQVT